MGALVLADPAGGTRPGSRRRYAVPVLLIAGWLGLFAYSAAYLTEDLPFRSPSVGAAPSVDMPSEQQAAARRVVLLDAPARSAPESSVPAPAPADPAAAPAPLARSAPAAAGAAVSSPTSAEYVGVWGPTPGACGAPSRRRGYIPATITPDHARAGRTLCTFHDTRRTGNAWVTAADCTDRGRRWSSQVRLTVDGDHLTWSSSRGSTTYVRCGRRTG
ncbi:peptidase inhibitor family I36 protein [Methylobacterium mesophilicum SR1.6/6]|uniref:Peptidase inhibitor family I36 protein n=1 Tax=Methylobacterium mesophilicum SR1.6/6 TaxID=908290 RepID=A0A6B9G3P7_9HYPH|nr:hypothetical protein [Methylobacterium mesophilicum]QGY06155.1 peptidase inhibitor family I36 protein [Methylobacterium mesophilicum SR1.6/6]